MNVLIKVNRVLRKIGELCHSNFQPVQAHLKTKVIYLTVADLKQQQRKYSTLEHHSAAQRSNGLRGRESLEP